MCDSMDYIEYNVSQIAREFGLSGTNYWLSDYSDTTDAGGYTSKAIGRDFNYFTFNFNFMHEANLYDKNNSTYGTDACAMVNQLKNI